MKKRKSIILSAITCMFSICLMMFGVYAASSPNVSVSGQVSYTARDAKVLVQGKINGAKGQSSTVDYPSATISGNVVDATKVTSENSKTYLDFTAGTGSNGSDSDLSPWKMGTLELSETSNGVSPVSISFKLTNLSTYPVKASIVFDKTDDVLEQSNLSRSVTATEVVLSQNGDSKEVVVTYAIVDDSQNVTGTNLLGMNIKFEKYVQEFVTLTFVTNWTQTDQSGNSTQLNWNDSAIRNSNTGEQVKSLKVEKGKSWSSIVTENELSLYNTSEYNDGTNIYKACDNCDTDLLHLHSKSGCSANNNGVICPTFSTDDPTFTTDTTIIINMHTVYDSALCFWVDTEIWCYDKKRKKFFKKKAKDIDYDDDIVVWNFDEGKIDFAKPLFIMKHKTASRYTRVTFSDGSIVKFVGSSDKARHRIYNVETGRFEYVGTDMPLGTKTLNVKGEIVTLEKMEFVDEDIEYTNIITERHFNCFTGNILSSCRLNNMYKIKDNKYVKDDRKIRPITDFEGVDQTYYDGLRLGEQPVDVNNGADVVYENNYTEFVNRWLSGSKPRK